MLDNEHDINLLERCAERPPSRMTEQAAYLLEQDEPEPGAVERLLATTLIAGYIAAGSAGGAGGPGADRRLRRMGPARRALLSATANRRTIQTRRSSRPPCRRCHGSRTRSPRPSTDCRPMRCSSSVPTASVTRWETAMARSATCSPSICGHHRPPGGLLISSTSPATRSTMTGPCSAIWQQARSLQGTDVTTVSVPRIDIGSLGHGQRAGTRRPGPGHRRKRQADQRPMGSGTEDVLARRSAVAQCGRAGDGYRFSGNISSAKDRDWLEEKTAWPASIAEDRGMVCGFLMRVVPRGLLLRLSYPDAGNPAASSADDSVPAQFGPVREWLWPIRQ